MASPAPWQIGLARIEGALPFLSPSLQAMIAARALRRLWAIHVRDYPFENYGSQHEPNLDAHELMRTSYIPERNGFLSWVGRRGPPLLADAARIALAAKDTPETFSSAFENADRALERIDAHLPSRDPAATLAALVTELIEEELDFLESGTEVHVILGRPVDRAATRGAAWAASLAFAMRPHLFGLGGSGIAFAGLTPRSLFRPMREVAIGDIVADGIATAAAIVRLDLDHVVRAEALGAERLADRNSSSQALNCWRLLVGLGPMTRAETARALGVTKRTASQAGDVLQAADLAQLQGRYGALALSRGFGTLEPVRY